MNALLGESIRRLVQAAFNAAATNLDESELLASNDTRIHRFGVRLRPDASVRVCGEEVVEVSMEGNARLCTTTVPSPGVFRYGHPTQSLTERQVTVEHFALGETSIIHDNDRIAIDMDLSELQLPPLSHVRFLRTSAATNLDFESFAITRPEALRVKGELKVTLYSISANDA